MQSQRHEKEQAARAHQDQEQRKTGRPRLARGHIAAGDCFRRVQVIGGIGSPKRCASPEGGVNRDQQKREEHPADDGRQRALRRNRRPFSLVCRSHGRRSQCFRTPTSATPQGGCVQHSPDPKIHTYSTCQRRKPSGRFRTGPAIAKMRTANAAANQSRIQSRSRAGLDARHPVARRIRKRSICPQWQELTAADRRIAIARR